MFKFSQAVVVCAVGGLIVIGNPARAERFADVFGSYEMGANTDQVFESDPAELFDNPLAALGGPDEIVTLSQGTETSIVSLGSWTDDPAHGDNSNPTGLIVGFSTPVPNIDGDDFLVVGNAPLTFVFLEPGFVEVAQESNGIGATTSGWEDEHFYLIRPSNFNQITDPRTAATSIEVTSDPVTFELAYSDPFADRRNLNGYFDVTNGGDAFDIANAIDTVSEPVHLTDISYVRLRAVSDSLFPFGSAIAPEVDYIQVTPEPSSGLLVLGSLFALIHVRKV